MNQGREGRRGREFPRGQRSLACEVRGQEKVERQGQKEERDAYLLQLSKEGSHQKGLLGEASRQDTRIVQEEEGCQDRESRSSRERR